MAKNTRLRFSVEDDLCVLRQVMANNPFDDSSQWKVIQRNVVAKTGKEFTPRAIREHVDLLLRLFLKEDKANLKKSGSQQQYEEKCKLLQTIGCLKREFVIVESSLELLENPEQNENGLEEFSQIVDSQENEENVIADIVKHEEDVKPKYILSLEKNDGKKETSRPPSAASSTASINQSTTNTKKRKLKKSVTKLNDPLQDVETENDMKRKMLDLEERKLHLEERRLILEEQKFELEKRERTMRLEMEINERRAALREKEGQQEILKFFMDNFSTRK